MTRSLPPLSSLSSLSLSSARPLPAPLPSWRSTWPLRTTVGLLLTVAACTPGRAAAEGAPSRPAAAPAPTLAAAAKPYTLSIAPVSAKKGQPATAQVVVKASPTYHMNLDYPLTLKLVPPAGVTLAKASLTKQDAKLLTAQEGQLEVVLTGSEVGAKSVAGELRFAVCTEDTCEPQKVAIAIAVDVK